MPVPCRMGLVSPIAVTSIVTEVTWAFRTGARCAPLNVVGAELECAKRSSNIQAFARLWLRGTWDLRFLGSPFTT
jgi:hypothetical protein